MGYTNKTSHYDLPQWIAGDKPSWLGDVNTAMLNIDTAIAGADASATAAESSAAAANAKVQAQEAKITKNTTDIQALTEQLADVSGVANAALPKNGGTMTGALTLAGAPTQDLQAATKKYVDDNAGAGVVYFMPPTPSGVTTTFLAGCAIERAIILSGFINVVSEQSAGITLGTFDGNPFNLQQGGSARTCGFLTDMTTTIACKAAFDGTNTKITTAATLPVAKYILSAGGEF